MTDRTTVTAHGLSGGTLHAGCAINGDYVVMVAPIEGENAVVVLSRKALRELALAVLRMTEPPEEGSDEFVLAAWDHFHDRGATRLQQIAERELRRRGIPVPKSGAV